MRVDTVLHFCGVLSSHVQWRTLCTSNNIYTSIRGDGDAARWIKNARRYYGITSWRREKMGGGRKISFEIRFIFFFLCFLSLDSPPLGITIFGNNPYKFSLYAHINAIWFSAQSLYNEKLYPRNERIFCVVKRVIKSRILSVTFLKKIL